MNKQTTHNIISQSSFAEYDIKKSHFVASIMPCTTEAEAVQNLAKLTAEHPHANHLAFAWRIRQDDGFINERCHDAGEPSGTAGRPILALLQGHSIINAVVGVIRYFGGIKLGTGGLARAYGTTAKLAIEHAAIMPWVEYTRFKLDLEYAQLQLLEYHLEKCQGKISEQLFTDKIQLTITMPAKDKEKILQLFPHY